MVERNLDAACRLCLNPNSKNINLFQNDGYRHILATLASTLSIRMVPNDLLPTVICPVCMEKIVSFNSFKKQCQDSQRVFQLWRSKKVQPTLNNLAEKRPSVTIKPIVRPQPPPPQPNPQNHSLNNSNVEIKDEPVDFTYGDESEEAYQQITPEVQYQTEEAGSYDSEYNPSKTKHSFKSPNKKVLAAKRRRLFETRQEFNYELIVDMLKNKVCKFCLQRFRGKNNGGVIQHVRLYHMDIPMNICYHCRGIYAHKKEQSQHRKVCRLTCREKGCKMCVDEDEEEEEKEDVNEGKFLCPHCDTRFETVEDWSFHRTALDLNSEENGLKCDQCTALFDNITDLEQHKMTHEISKPDKEPEEPAVEEEEEEPPQAEEIDTSQVSEGTSDRPRRDKNYKCEDCGKVFYHPQRYSAHRQAHKSQPTAEPVQPPPNPALQCRRCFKTFPYPSKLRDHLKSCERRHTAPILVKTLMHTPSIPASANRFLDADGGGTCPYAACSKKFPNKLTLFKHMLRCMSKPRDFPTFQSIHPEAVKCPTCRRFFMSPKSYTRHKTLGCGGIPTGQNESLPIESFEQPFSFEMLQNGSYKPPQDSEFTCENCNKVTQTKSGMVEHRKYCHFKLTSCCVNCNLPFEDIESFRLHYTEEHAARNTSILPTPLECTKCNKWFNSLRSYRVHMVKQHQLNISNRNLSTGYAELGANLVQFECEYCHKMFASRSSMRKHIRKVCLVAKAQTEPNPMDLLETYQQDDEEDDDAGASQIMCGVCNSNFENIGELRQHILVKHKPDSINKQFFCQYCKMAFNEEDDLKSHFINYHNVDPYDNSPSPDSLLMEVTPDIMGDKEDMGGFECENCSLQLNSAEDLESHMATCESVEA